MAHNAAQTGVVLVGAALLQHECVAGGRAKTAGSRSFSHFALHGENGTYQFFIPLTRPKEPLATYNFDRVLCCPAMTQFPTSAGQKT